MKEKGKHVINFEEIGETKVKMRKGYIWVEITNEGGFLVSKETGI